MWNSEVAEVMKAFYEEHKPIQYTIADEWANGSGIWHDIEAPNCDLNKYDYRINWDWNKYKYRIKPEDECTAWALLNSNKIEQLFVNEDDAFVALKDARMFDDAKNYTLKKVDCKIRGTE